MTNEQCEVKDCDRIGVWKWNKTSLCEEHSVKLNDGSFRPPCFGQVNDAHVACQFLCQFRDECWDTAETREGRMFKQKWKTTKQ